MAMPIEMMPGMNDWLETERKRTLPMPVEMMPAMKGGKTTAVPMDLVLDMNERCVFLFSDVEDMVAAEICHGLLVMNKCDPAAPIEMYINSPGGSVTAGLAIYDIMCFIKAPVHTICIGMAASMGAFLLAGGTPGKRYALPNSEIMIHQPLGGMEFSQATDIVIRARALERTKDHLNMMLAEFTGQPYETICEDTDRDNFMTAEQAKAYGLIDHVIDSGK